MNNTKKILILNNLAVFAAVSFMLYLFLSQQKIAVIALPAGPNLNTSSDYFSFYLQRKDVFLGQPTISDPKQGNSGEVNISAESAGDLMKVSWPEEYQIYYLTLKDLGESEEIGDNATIFGFTTDKSQSRLFPKPGPFVVERNKIEPPIAIDPSFKQDFLRNVVLLPAEMLTSFKKGHGYSIEALFEKPKADSNEVEDKIYTGLLRFTF